jgi:hypothetical protein
MCLTWNRYHENAAIFGFTRVMMIARHSLPAAPKGNHAPAFRYHHFGGFLVACVLPAEQARQQSAAGAACGASWRVRFADENRCIIKGYQDGTDAFPQCVRMTIDQQNRPHRCTTAGALIEFDTALRRMSDDEIEQAALGDPDAQPLSDARPARGFRPKRLAALRKRLGLSSCSICAPTGLGAEAPRT